MNPPLLDLCPPSQDPTPDLLRSPDSFVWWYADLLDDNGDGAVLIWSWGLPFLPGMRAAMDEGASRAAGSWPALNLAVYKAGRPAFYSLTRFAESDASWIREDEWWFGDTRIRRERNEHDYTLRADLHVPLPSGRVARGHLRVGGTRRQAGQEQRPHGVVHDWSPLSGPSHGELELEVPDAQPLTVRGRAYHDRNGGTRPLWDLDIDYWLWGRAPLSEGQDIIWYLLWPPGGGEPKAIVVLIDEQGRTEQPAVQEVLLCGDHRSWTGGRVPRGLTVRLADGRRLEVDRRSLVDDGPFYHRAVVDVSFAGGPRVAGTAEGVEPDRIDASWQRPLVRMRVLDQTRREGFFQPLFLGMHEGRFGRLFRRRRQLPLRR